MLDTDGQVLIFVRTRHETVKLSKALSKTLCRYFSASIEIESESEKIKRQMEEVVKCGVAFHHAGLDTPLRTSIEDAFRERKLKTVVATTTLSAGVNLPARRVIITYVAEYKQMAGRAEWLGLDPYGEAIIMGHGNYDRYIKGEPEVVRSFLRMTIPLRRVILSLAVGSYISSIEDVETLLSKEFGKVPREHIQAVIQQLEELGVMQNFTPTDIGWYAIKFYIDPEFAVLIQSLRNEKDPIKIIYTIAHHEEFRPPLKKYKHIEGEGDAASIASAILDWINEVDEDVILDRYGLGPGDLYHYAETFDWLATAAYVITKNPVIYMIKRE